MGRSKIDPECPTNYPYILYKVNNDLVLATSITEARKRYGTNVKVAKLNDLISANGHTKTSSILKTIGDEWICKGGNIFYG